MKHHVKLAIILGTLPFSLAASDMLDERIWVTIGADAVQHYQLKNTLVGEQIHSKLSSHQQAHMLNIAASQVNELSEFMHDNYHRCGGFVAHDSLMEANAYLAQLVAVDNKEIQPFAVNYSIDNPDMANSLLSQITVSNLNNTVNTMSAFHNRYYTQQTGVDASEWLKNHWQQIVQSRNDISVEYFTHSWAQSSVIVTIPGNEKADEIVVIGGHLDSINSANASGGRAPGADDNASGIAVLTEALRAVVASDFKPKRTIKVMGFAAEEVGLRGSKAIAESYKSQGKNVVGMAQFDMTGRHGSTDDIVMMTDYTNNGQNQFLGQLIDAYLPAVSYGFDQCGYGCSDHASWYQQGYAASMPFESRMADINRKIHTINDTEFDADHASKFAKLAVIYLAELAKSAGTIDPPPVDNVLENGVAKTGINGAAKQQLFYSLNVPLNGTNLQFTTAGGTGDADLYVKFGTKPTLQSYDCKSTNSNSVESCAITPLQVGTYHVMVEAWNAISDVSLTGRYQIQTGAPEPIERTENSLTVARGGWLRFNETLASGYQNLTVSLSGGTGDADLYVKHSTDVSDTVHDCRPYKNGNQETCTFDAPAAGQWFIGLKGYSNANGVTLKILAN
ncbi:M28 family metallopeptidase [Pseudoalteromonas aurantia]|uniref:Aminopeptidase n=2 Tax=Pseudoalteromonas TaxID=53246 RepID=A0A5S3VCA3_9GAMM|nr:M28 family metallopeptidase [Pseudoalteromonas aurantia]TMO69711.1 aminopeptidase [Pseudoalteromonas aurantia]